jgi:hypothetical protein
VKTTRQPEDGRQGRHSSLVGRSSVDVHIEELVLEGFAPGERHRIAAAVQQELARLISQGGVPQSVENPAALARLDAGALHIQAGAPARTTGAKIGAAVYRSLRQDRADGATRPGGPARGVGSR